MSTPVPLAPAALGPSRLRPAGLLAGSLSGVGLGLLFTVPGGGSVDDQAITDFYSSSGHRAAALVGFALLVAGTWAALWFVMELRTILPSGRRAGLGTVAAVFGLALVLTGGGVLVGPAAAMSFSGAAFVGAASSQAFAQAGLSVMLTGGFLTLGFALVLLGLTARPAAVLRRGVPTAAVVMGVLLVTATIGVGALLWPLWLLVAGAAGPRPPS